MYSLIQSNNEEGLSYWLFFNSFLNYELKKICEEYDFTLSTIPDELLKKINDRINLFLREQSTKKTLVKFSENDFNSTDFLSLNSNIKSVLLTLNSSDHVIGKMDVEPVVKAKSRRNEELRRNVSVQLIGCKDYAPHSTIRKLAKNIRDIKLEERKQFHYFHLSNNHAVGFDVERNTSGYKIFVFDPTGATEFFETVDLLYKKLKEMNLSFEIKAYPGGIQKDHMNCSIFVLSALREFAKYKHTFEYVNSSEHIRTVQETINNEYKAWTKVEGNGRSIHLTNMDKISWVAVSQLPTKIILLDQSYTNMATHLEKSPDFDLNANKLIELHKKKYHFDPEKEKSTKYINQKRKKIANYVGEFNKTTTEKFKAEVYQKFPLLESIHNQQLPDFSAQITNNPQLKIEDKLNAIKDLFIYICASNNFETIYSFWKNPTDSMTKTEFLSLILLRKEYIHLVSSVTKVDRNKLKDYFNCFSDEYSMIVNTNFENHLDEAMKKEIKFEPVRKLLEDNFNMDEVSTITNGKGFQNYENSDLSVDNPLNNFLLSEKPNTLTQVLASLNEFQNHYKTSGGRYFFTLRDTLEFIDSALSSTQPKLGEKNIPEINKETFNILKLAYLKYWLVVFELENGYREIPWLKNDELFKNANASFSPKYLEYLNALNVDINNHPNLDEKNKKIYSQAINDVYLKVLNSYADKKYHKMNRDFLPIANNLLPLLVGNLSKREIINQLDGISSLMFKLRILEITFEQVISSSDKNGYTCKQLTHISTLQKVYKEVIKKEPFDANNKKFNKRLANVAQESCLMCFVPVAVKLTFFGHKTQTASILSLEGLINGEHRSKVTEPKTEVTLKNNSAAQTSNTTYVSELEHLKQSYEETPFNGWIQYTNKELKIDVKEWGYDNWKLNLSIHPDDLEKALLIIGDVAINNKLGVFKIMSKDQVKAPCANMVGRQVAIYYDANPEFDSEIWFNIIKQIEDGLRHGDIRPSCQPVSNRKIGEYTSYTHDAWVNDSGHGVVPFDEGIIETALDDEDPLSNFYYDEVEKSIAKKMTSPFASI